MLDSIRKYYSEQLVNPNNKGLPQGDEICEKIEQLREMLLDVFEWRLSGNIVFLPNAYYAKALLVHFFRNCGHKNIKFYSNSMSANHDLIEGLFRTRVDYISKASELDGKDNLVYFASLYEESHQDALNDLVREENKKHIPELGKSYSKWSYDDERYLVVETFTDDPKYVDQADAFIYNVIPGVTVLGFRKAMKIEPLFLGAGSVDYADETSYKIKDDYRVLESGTLNVPLLLALETYYRNKIRKESIE